MNTIQNKAFKIITYIPLKILEFIGLSLVTLALSLITIIGQGLAIALGLGLIFALFYLLPLKIALFVFGLLFIISLFTKDGSSSSNNYEPPRNKHAGYSPNGKNHTTGAYSQAHDYSKKG